MCFALLVQVAVVASTESCLAGDAECASDSSVLIQKTVVTAHSFDGEESTEDCKGDWDVNRHKYPDSMTMTVVVEINGVDQTKGALAAFIGDEIHGIEMNPLSPPFGPHEGKKIFYHFMIYGDKFTNGKKITFKFRACDGTVTELEPSLGPMGVFKVNGHFGNVLRKTVLKGTATMAAEALPPCQDNDAGFDAAVSHWGISGGCMKWKGFCIGLTAQMKEFCQATCKDKLRHLLKGICS